MKPFLRSSAYVAAGAAAVYATAAWMPALFFAWQFQGAIGRNDPRCGLGALLHARALPAAEASGAGEPASTVPSAGRWGALLHRGLLLPIPPGIPKGIVAEKENLSIVYQGARIVVTPMPGGTIRKIFEDERERLGGSCRSAGAAGEKGMNDLDVAIRAASTTPEDFRLSLRAEERAEYAAAILTKILLWDPPASASTAGTPAFRTYRSADGRSGLVHIQWPDLVRALVIAPDVVLSVRIDGQIPAEWLEEPWRWGAVRRASGQEAEGWRAEAARSFPEGHPLRRWAERG
jgi:hypothetical protein